jgi:glutamyl-tRNA(Gln) amidotransferase subunit E
VWAPEQEAATAAREILIRAQDALVGVPAETRQPYRDGTNGFERILPGPDRMYPDTDTPPLPVPDNLVIEVHERLPEPPWVRERRYETVGLEPASARRLSSAPWADLFDALAPADAATARRLAAALEKRIPYHRRGGVAVDATEVERLRPVIRAIESGAIRAEALEHALDRLIRLSGQPVEELLAGYLSGPDDLTELEGELTRVVARATALAGKPAEAVLRWAMGQVMPRFLGRLDPAVVRDRLQVALEGVVAEVET